MEMKRILLRPLHSWVWIDTARRARKLLRFAETEADGGRDLVRAAEVTPDPLLRRLFLFHARDEQRHAELFRQRGSALLHPLAGVISGLILTILYFTLLAPFAYLAKRAACREPTGWSPVSPERNSSLDRQY